MAIGHKKKATATLNWFCVWKNETVQQKHWYWWCLFVYNNLRLWMNLMFWICLAHKGKSQGSNAINIEGLRFLHNLWRIFRFLFIQLRSLSTYNTLNEIISESECSKTEFVACLYIARVSFCGKMEKRAVVRIRKDVTIIFTWVVHSWNRHSVPVFWIRSNTTDTKYKKKRKRWCELVS